MDFTKLAYTSQRQVCKCLLLYTDMYSWGYTVHTPRMNEKWLVYSAQQQMTVAVSVVTLLAPVPLPHDCMFWRDRVGKKMPDISWDCKLSIIEPYSIGFLELCWKAFSNYYLAAKHKNICVQSKTSGTHWLILHAAWLFHSDKTRCCTENILWPPALHVIKMGCPSEWECLA